MILFFYLFIEALGYYVYKPFTTVQQGPCDSTSNMLQIPNSLLGPAFTQFTITGWFRKNSATSTTNNLLFLVGPDTNNYANFHLAATLNTQLKIQSCFTIKNCTVIESADLVVSDVDDIWIFLLVSINFQTKLLHYKLITQSDSQSRPYIHSQTQELQAMPTFTNSSGIVIKNKVVSLYNFTGFCGKFKEFSYYGNLYTESRRQSYNYDVEYIAYWMTKNPSTTSALNALSAAQDLGTLVGGVTFDSNWGWEFSQNKYAQFINLRSTFGDRFMITANVYIGNSNSEMNFLYRKDQNGNQLLSIKFISTGTSFSVKVSIAGVMAESHGQLNGQLNQWQPILIGIYNNYNFYPDAATPGMALIDIITPTFQEYGKKAQKVYSDALSDQYFIGDYPATSVWQAGANKFKYANIRIFRGYNYLFDSSNTKGCMIEVGELFPVCIACNKFTNSGAADSNSMCSEAGTYGVPASMGSSDLITCPQGQVYASSQCQVINIDYCLRGTNVNTCTTCIDGYALSSNKCIAAFASHCLTGTYECISQYFGDFTTYVPVLISLKCIEKYYLDNTKQCLPCNNSCKTCGGGTTCASCIANEYLLKETTLCNATCDTTYKDTDLMVCVDGCTSTQVTTDDIKTCSLKCPTSYVQSEKVCLTSCPLNTFSENGICKSCDSKCYECNGSSNKQCTKCNDGYFLLTTICEDFCADKNKYANQLLNQCTDTCDPPGVIYGMNCLYVCPTSYTVDNVKKCQLQCPDGYVSVIDSITVTSPVSGQTKQVTGQKCVPCADGCKTCDGIDESPTTENCINCVTGNFLVDKNCDTSCPVATPLEDSLNQRCLISCPPQFYQYNSTCVLKCPDSSYSYDQQCNATCPDGTYAETTNNSCLLCAFECNTCNEGGPSHCLTCKGGYYQYDTVCVQVCPSDRKFHNTVTFVCESVCPNYYLDDGTNYECYDQCPLNYNVDGTRCTYYCSVGKYLDIDTCKVCEARCARCDDGTNTSCTKCATGYYLDGRTCSTTCDENPTYYRSDYGYVCVEKCPGTLLMVDSLRKCVASCPNTHVKLLDHCLLSCPVGYYSDANSKCQICPQECTQCVSDTSCQKCATKYFQQDDKCLRTCLNGFYQNLTTYQCQATCDKLINNDGLNNLQCLDTCPDIKVQYGNQCIYECPDGYYKNVELKNCSLCSIECKTCTGATNEDCLECQSGFQWKDDFCVGVCPAGQFLNYVSCEACAFRCVNCVDSKYNCQVCKGNRKGAPQCLCDTGYFDDRKNNDCQKCQAPCVTCQSLTFCQSCNYNLEPPDCKCKRPPPVTTNYCITCKLSFAESVRFSSDFSQIIVIFTYALTTNSENAFYLSKENCQLWFENDNFGESPICQQNGNKFIIQLGNNPTIMPGNKVAFKKNTFIDDSLQLCQDTYIEQFNNTELILSVAIIPNVVLSYPDSFITNCVDITIEVIKEVNNGGRALIYYAWTTNSTEEGLINTLSQYGSSSYLKIPAKTLQPDLNYSISVTYGNFLGSNRTTTITIMTTSKNPSLLTTFDSSKTYYANFDVAIPYKLYSYTCDTDNIQELTESYPVNLNIKSISTGTSQYTEDQASDSGVDKSFTLPANKLKASSDYTIELSVSNIKITKALKFGSNQLFAEFITKDRIVGNTTFNLTVNASDSDVPANQSKIGLSYSWTCTNLFFNIPCRTTLNKPLILTNNETVNVSALPSGYVYQFKCTVTKEARTISLLQQIIVSDLNMTEKIFSTDLGNKETLVVTDNLLYNLDVLEYYLVIIRYFAILKIEYIQKSVLRLNLYYYLSQFTSQQEISILIGGTLTRYNLRVKPALQLTSLTSTPQTGHSLETTFTFLINNGTVVENDTTQYQLYVYQDLEDLQWDLGNFSNSNGFLLFDWTKELSITTQLPSCQHILVKINKDDQFGMTYLNVSVTKSKTSVSIKNNIEFMTTFMNFNLTDLFLDQLIIMELYFLESNKCNYNCWNRGECVNDVCVCDQDYMKFSDCSGILNDQDKWDALASKLYVDLSKAEQTQTVINSVALLLQLSKFTNVIALTSIELLSTQIDTYLQPQNVDTGIISQSLQSADYKSAFNILNFMSSLNKQLFTNDSNVDQMKSINQKLFESVNKLVLYTSDTLLEGEKQVFQSSSLLIQVQKKSAKRRLLSTSANLFVDSYYETNILRLLNNFPYPNHTQELYYSTAQQNRTYSAIKQIRSLRNIYGFTQDTTNYVCILSEDGKIFDDTGCDTSSQSPPINCVCQAGYVTLVDDSQYYYKPFYFEISYSLDKLILAMAYGGFFVLILILLVVGHIKDSRDLDLVKPIIPGLKKSSSPPRKINTLRKVRRNQVFPGESDLFSPAVEIEKSSVDDFRSVEGQSEFRSKASISNCLRMNTIFGSVLLFKKNIGRKQRLILLLSRVSLNTAILGFIVNLQIIEFYQIILFVVGLGFVFRILNVLCKYLNQKTSKRKECIYIFFSYLLTTLFLFSGLLCLVIIYFNIYDRLVIYWGLSLACVLVVELILTDFILQLCQLLYDYYKYRRQISEDDDDEAYEQIYSKKQNKGDYDSQSKLE